MFNTNIKRFSVGILALASSLLIISAKPIFAVEIAQEYRTGAFFKVNGIEYLATTNKSFVELFYLSDTGKMEKITEFGTTPEAKQVIASTENNKPILLVLSQRYITKYNIENIYAPKVILQRDMKAWRGKTGLYPFGALRFIAANDYYVFVASDRGVRRLVKENLFEDKAYTLESVFGLAVDNNSVAAILSDKGIVFDMSTGVKKGEVVLTNKELGYRYPTIDIFGNIYFLSDNAIVKTNSLGKELRRYSNPVKSNDTFSYYVSASSDGSIYYANGYGISKFDKNFKKISWHYSGSGAKYGVGSWAVGVIASDSGRIALLNKTSILILDNNLKFLSQYRYKALANVPMPPVLNIKITGLFFLTGQKANFEVFGFWPNEEVNVAIGDSKVKIFVNNYGYGKGEIIIPKLPHGVSSLTATGVSSTLTYQTTLFVN